MIRNATSSDVETLISLSIDSGLFSEDLAEDLRDEIEGFFADPAAEGQWIVESEGEATRGAAFFEPELFTQGTWNLQFIAVHRDHQGEGVGGALIAHIEAMLRRTDERVLIVETSGVDDFEETRAFYSKHGFTEEARIRDFYSEGDDKVVFWKGL